MKTSQEIFSHRASLEAHLAQAKGALASFSVGLFTAREWQEGNFLIRQIEAEIELLNWVLGLRDSTWLEELDDLSAASSV